MPKHVDKRQWMYTPAEVYAVKVTLEKYMRAKYELYTQDVTVLCAAHHIQKTVHGVYFTQTTLQKFIVFVRVGNLRDCMKKLISKGLIEKIQVPTDHATEVPYGLTGKGISLIKSFNAMAKKQFPDV